MRGLPDVTDYVDLDSVAAKATRDARLAGQLTYAGVIAGSGECGHHQESLPTVESHQWPTEMCMLSPVAYWKI
jgi:hypothetical protein